MGRLLPECKAELAVSLLLFVILMALNKGTTHPIFLRILFLVFGRLTGSFTKLVPLIPVRLLAWLRFFSSRPLSPSPLSPLSLAHDMVRNRLACTTTRQRTPPLPPVVLCPLFVLSSCLAQITYGTTAPSKGFLDNCMLANSPTIRYSLNRLQDAQGTPHNQVDCLAYVAKLDPPWPLFGFFRLLVLQKLRSLRFWLV